MSTPAAPANATKEPRKDAQPRKPPSHEFYVKCLVEMVILRGEQRRYHSEIAALEALTKRMSASAKGPTQQSIHSKKLKELKSEQEVVRQRMSERLNYLAGTSDVFPKHDILYPDGEPASNGPKRFMDQVRAVDETISRVAEEYAILLPSRESLTVDGTPAKRRRMNPSPLESLQAIEDSLDQATRVTSNLVSTSIPKAQANAQAALDEKLAEIVQQREAEQTKLRDEVEARKKEWIALRENELKELQEDIEERRVANEELRREVDQLRAFVERMETSVASNKATLMGLQQAPTTAPASDLLTHPQMIALLAPIRHALTANARAFIQAQLTEMASRQDGVVHARTEDLRTELEKTFGPTIQLWEDVQKSLMS